MACSCNNDLFCSQHLVNHQAAQRNHIYIPIVPTREDQSFNLVLESLLEHFSYLNLLKKKVLSEAKILIGEIIKSSNNAVKQISIYEHSLISSISFLNKQLDPKNRLQDYLKDLVFRSKKQIENEVTQFWLFPTISNQTRTILPLLEKLFNIGSVDLPYFLNEHKYLYFFVDDSMMFTSFNVKKLTTNSFRLPLKANRGAAAVFCYLPNSKMFYGGGIVKNKTIAQYMIIDEASGEVKEIRDGVPRKQAGTCVIEDSVLVFAGCDGDRAMKTCQKLCIQTMKWEKLPDLPYASDTSVTVLYNQVYITGGQITGLLTYAPSQNLYLSVFDFLDKKNKFLCSGLGKMYLLYEGEIYVSENQKPWEWRRYELQKRLGKYWVAAWVLYKENIYFTTGHYHFFDQVWPIARKLNLSTFEIQDIN